MGRSSDPAMRLLALALLLLASSSEAADRLAKRSTAPDVVRPRIVNGVLTSDFPSVGALVTPSNQDLAITICSGTLIGCSTFLTAAHCVCGGTGDSCQSGPGAPDPSDYMVFLQHAGFLTVDSVSVHPDFDFPTADVAVLQLSQPVESIRPTPINDVSTPPPGSEATIVGFGRSGGSNFDYSLKRQGQIETVDCNDPTLVCWEYEAPLGLPGEDSNTCNGDSGGPLFWDPGTGPVVAGITSGGQQEACLTNDFSFDANVFEYHGFIESIAGADLANTACGSGPQVGEEDAEYVGFQGTLSTGNISDDHAIAVATGTTELRISMNASEAAADFDLYVKFGSPASTSDFDCKADGPTQLSYCAFTDPTPGNWYVLARRVSGSAQYQVTATLIAASCTPEKEGLPCNDGNACTVNEVCASGQCVGLNAANGTPCDDGQRCTSNDACSAGACVSNATPRTGCKSTESGASMLLLKEGTPVTQVPDSKDKLGWKWKKGEETSLADFGTLNATDGFDLCLYRELGGDSTVLMETRLPAGSLWFPTAKGYRYRDRNRANGGVDTIKLFAGDDGAARFTLSAKGENLPMPPMPIPAGSVLTLQLVGENACFESTFSSFTKNQADQLKASSD